MKTHRQAFQWVPYSYARILIGSHLWSIGGQTHRWRQRSIQVWQLRDSLNESQFFAKHGNQSVCFILYRQQNTSKCYLVAKFEKGSFPYILILYYIKQIDSMLPCVCSVIDHRGRQNVVTTLLTHSAVPRVPLFCSYHILTSSVIYYWTDARQHGIYLSNRAHWWHIPIPWLKLREFPG